MSRSGSDLELVATRWCCAANASDANISANATVYRPLLPIDRIVNEYLPKLRPPPAPGPGGARAVADAAWDSIIASAGDMLYEEQRYDLMRSLDEQQLDELQPRDDGSHLYTPTYLEHVNGVISRLNETVTDSMLHVVEALYEAL